METELLKQEITGVLNDFLEERADYFKEEYGCEEEEIVDLYGFGYSKDKKTIFFLEGDNIIDCKATLVDISKSWLLCKTDADRIALIEKIKDVD